MTYYGQYGIDKVIEDNYLEDFDPNGWMIECGAGNGVNDSVCLHFEQEYGFRVINIEAVPDLYEQLCNNRPESKNIQAAMSSFYGTTTFNLATKLNEIPGGSVSYQKDYDKYLLSIGYRLNPIQVKTCTYDLFTMTCSSVELLVLDVEGHELKVISGINLNMPKVICVEYTLSGLEEIKSSLASKGYRFDFVSENNALFSIGIEEKNWSGKTETWRF